jgi:hypothetical protein
MTEKAISEQKPTYWVRSKQTIGPNGTPAPLKFKTLAAAKRRLLELNLCKGPYHPGYLLEVQDDRPPLFSIKTGNRNHVVMTRPS